VYEQMCKKSKCPAKGRDKPNFAFPAPEHPNFLMFL
jgi:hypothetical protein